MSQIALLLAQAASTYSVSRSMGRIAGVLLLIALVIWGVKKLGVFRDKR